MLPNKFRKVKHKKSANHTALANIAFLITTIIWAGAGPIIKLTLEEIPPSAFLFLRFLIVCIVLLPFVWTETKKTKIHKKDYKNLLLLGLFSQTALIGAFWGLNLTSVLDYTIIGLLGTMISIYAGHHYFHDKLNKKVITGLILATAGTLVIIFEPLFTGQINGHSPSTRLLGNIIALVFNATWVIYIMWSKMVMGEKSKDLKRLFKRFHLKPMKKSYSPTLIVAITFYVGLASMIPLVFLERFGVFGNFIFDYSSISTSGVLGLLYMSILSSIVAYMLYQWGLNNAHIYDAALYGYLGPLFTLPIAYMLLGEVPNKITLLSGILIAIGVIIAEKENT